MYLFAVEIGLLLMIPTIWFVLGLRWLAIPDNFGRYLSLSAIYPAPIIGIVAILAFIYNQDLSKTIFINNVMTIIISIWLALWVINLIYVFTKYIIPLTKFIFETKTSSKK